MGAGFAVQGQLFWLASCPKTRQFRLIETMDWTELVLNGHATPIICMEKMQFFNDQPVH